MACGCIGGVPSEGNHPNPMNGGAVYPGPFGRIPIPPLPILRGTFFPRTSNTLNSGSPKSSPAAAALASPAPQAPAGGTDSTRCRRFRCRNRTKATAEAVNTEILPAGAPEFTCSSHGKACAMEPTTVVAAMSRKSAATLHSTNKAWQPRTPASGPPGPEAEQDRSSISRQNQGSSPAPTRHARVTTEGSGLET